MRLVRRKSARERLIGLRGFSEQNETIENSEYRVFIPNHDPQPYEVEYYKQKELALIN